MMLQFLSVFSFFTTDMGTHNIGLMENQAKLSLNYHQTLFLGVSFHCFLMLLAM